MTIFGIHIEAPLLIGIFITFVLAVSVTFKLTRNKIVNKGNSSPSAINNANGTIDQKMYDGGVNTGDHSPVAIALPNSTNVRLDNINFHFETAPNVPNTQVNQAQGASPVEKKAKLSDFVEPESPIIDGETFIDKEICGPCMIYPLSNVTITGGSWGGTPQSLFVEVTDVTDVIQGVIGLRNCRFINCDFKNVGIIGKRTVLEIIKKGFNWE